MNCDDAFDRLTDPVGRDDAALQRHLAGCARCREMQQTLSPALAWFHEVAPWQTADRTQTGGPLLTVQALRIAEQAARSLPPVRRPIRQRWWQSMAAMVLFLLSGMAAGAYQARQSDQLAAAEPAASAMLASSCLWLGPKVSAEVRTQTSRDVILSCVACHVPKTSAPN